jgi:hypothetical protein
LRRCQLGAPGPDAVTETGHDHRSRGRSRTKSLLSTGLSGTPACFRVRLRLRFSSPSSGDQQRLRPRTHRGHLRSARRPAWWPLDTSPSRASRGSPHRHCAHRTRGGRGTMSIAALPPLRAFSCSAGCLVLGPRGAMKWRIGGVGRPGPTGAGRPISPVAFRSPACRFFFSDDWLRHAHSGELLQRHPAPSSRAQVISLPKSFRSGARSRRPWWRAMFEIVRRSRPGRGARPRRACIHPSGTVVRNCGPCPQPSIGTRSGGAWLPLRLCAFASLRLCVFALCSPVTDQTVSGNHGKRQRQRSAPGLAWSQTKLTPMTMPLVAWASSPRKDHSPSEQRPHDGQDARRLEFGH